MGALAAYMGAAGTRDLPAEAAEHAKHHLLDTLAAMISGSELLPGQMALRQRAKVSIVRDEELAKLLPARVTVVEIEFTDGTKLSERIADVRGTPRNPMSRAEVVGKARDLMVPVIGREKSEKLVEAVFAIEGLKDVRELRPLLQRG